jgi:hypothetical protein
MRKCVVQRPNRASRAERRGWRWLAGSAVATTALLVCGQARAAFLVNYDIPNKTGQTADALSVIMNANPDGTVPFGMNGYNGGKYWPLGESAPSVPGPVFSVFGSNTTTAGAVFGTASTTPVAEFRWDFAVPDLVSAPDGSKGAHIGIQVTNSTDCSQFAQRIFFRDTSGHIIVPHIAPIDPALCFIIGPASPLASAPLPTTLAPGQTATATLPIQVSAGMQVVSRVISTDSTGAFSMSVFRETDPAPAGTTGVSITLTNPIPPDGSQGVPMKITYATAAAFASPFQLTDLNPENPALVRMPSILPAPPVPALGGTLGAAALGLGLCGLGATLIRRRLRRS